MEATGPHLAVAAPVPTAIADASLPTYRWLGLMLAAIAALVAALGFAVDRHDLPLMAGLELFLLAAAMLMRLRGWGRVATAVEAALLIVAATMAAACLNALLATTGLPFRDALLDRIDHDLVPMVTWQGMFELLRRSGALVSVMCAVYQTLQWQPLLLVAMLALAGRERRCWRFVHAWLLALVLCLVVFPFMPALGEYRLHRLLPSDLPALRVDTAWRQGLVLERLRTGALRTLAPGSMTGLISFPSFHAAGGTLLAWGFAPLRWIGKPAVVLNVAMIATAPLIGAHYFIDIAAGVAVGALAIRLSRPRG